MLFLSSKNEWYSVNSTVFSLSKTTKSTSTTVWNKQKADLLVINITYKRSSLEESRLSANSEFVIYKTNTLRVNIEYNMAVARFLLVGKGQLGQYEFTRKHFLQKC